jgi:hypothetical protein
MNYQSRRYNSFILIILTILTALNALTGAQISLESNFEMLPVRKRQIIVQRIYNYEIREYRPSPSIGLLASAREASYKSPEETVIANVSAMMTQDWNWFLNTWSESSARQIKEDSESRGLTTENLVAKWAGLKGKKLAFVSRIDTGKYVIVTYDLVDEAGQKSRSLAPMMLENGRWLLTNDLHDDPALTAGLGLDWDSNGRAVVTKVIR